MYLRYDNGVCGLTFKQFLSPSFTVALVVADREQVVRGDLVFAKLVSRPKVILVAPVFD